jgi:2-polyprenyl-3-methyl-5-hydroxy-6-metoxy-1,4-benzoquinol methylase
MKREWIQRQHKMTERNYEARMLDRKIESMKVAREFGYDFFDGERIYGYGGYKYIKGRWQELARSLIEEYRLGTGSTILDVGCGKGFLLDELQRQAPGVVAEGIDISMYAVENSVESVKKSIHVGDAAKLDEVIRRSSYDLVVSINTIHNLSLRNVDSCLRMISNIGHQSYIVVEAFRDEATQHNMYCWALTAKTLMSEDDWVFTMERAGYTMDFEFIAFE